MRIIERIDGWITAETALLGGEQGSEPDDLRAFRLGGISILKALKHELEQEAKSGRGEDA